jgi:hypothetical protein
MTDNMVDAGKSLNPTTKPRAMDENGAVGKQFTGQWPTPSLVQLHDNESNLVGIQEQGALGGTAAKIGGPLDKDGVIGKQFTTEGSIGGTVQNAMGGQKDK